MTHQPVNNNTSDEIDVRQLFQIIGESFNKTGRIFLWFFLYLKKNLLILVGLTGIGMGIGFWLNQTLPPATKVVVLVQPYLESENYLHAVVAEINANLQTKDSSFFTPLGIHPESLTGFSVSVAAIENIKAQEEAKDTTTYAVLLQNFDDNTLLSEVVQTKILNNSALDHTITFRYNDREKGYATAKTLMDYINANPYFKERINTQRENFREKIEKNNALIAQIDTLIADYSYALRKKGMGKGTGLVQDIIKGLGIEGLLALKSELIRDSEQKRMEIKAQTAPIHILHFGKPQPQASSFFCKRIVWIPLGLLGLFFLFSFLQYLNRKAREVED